MGKERLNDSEKRNAAILSEIRDLRKELDNSRDEYKQLNSKFSLV